MNSTAKSTLLFPNLNGIRFLAAMMVFVHHVEQAKHDLGLQNYFKPNPYTTDLGGLGVTLFFVLSGFLITYLLMEEKNQTGNIAVVNFYIRRMLRIWPLYYLIVLLGFFIIPNFFQSMLFMDTLYYLNKDFYSKLAMYCFMLPNLAFVKYDFVLYASQAWSIGVEEQFYSVWPLIVKHTKRIVLVLFAIVVLFLIINYCLEFLTTRSPEDKARYSGFKSFFMYTRIDCMAVGGLFALAAIRQHPLHRLIASKAAQGLIYAAALVMVYFAFPFKGFGHLPYAIVFGAIISNLATNPASIVNLEYRLFDLGGKISYGIYMFHPMTTIVAVLILGFSIETMSQTTLNLTLYPLACGLTLAVAYLSYNFFEKLFLKKKVRFSAIITGDSVERERT